MKGLLVLLTLTLAALVVALWDLGSPKVAIAYGIAGAVLVVWVLFLTWRDDLNAKEARRQSNAAADAFIQKAWSDMAEWRNSRV